jgi:hypothetical protein
MCSQRAKSNCNNLLPRIAPDIVRSDDLSKVLVKLLPGWAICRSRTPGVLVALYQGAEVRRAWRLNSVGGLEWSPS